jgi:hypothetical protein
MLTRKTAFSWKFLRRAALYHQLALPRSIPIPHFAGKGGPCHYSQPYSRHHLGSNRKPECGPLLWLQPEVSLWPRCADGSPDPRIAVSVADCWHGSKLNCIASVSMSSWMFDEEECQERIRRNDTRQHQERNGEAAHGKVRTRRGNKSRKDYWHKDSREQMLETSCA